jgi:two-component system OmpR family sensor kinase
MRLPSRRSDGRPRTRSSARHTEELQRFLRRLDHELKNPLTAIRFALANLAATDLDPSQQDSIRSIETQTLRIGQLMADLRKLTDLGRVSIELAPVEIMPLLHEVSTLINEKPITRGRSVQLQIPQELEDVRVSGDRYLLLLAIYNCLDNALKFSSADDKVAVRLVQANDTLTIEITDEGPGIRPEDRAHVWEELYRGHGVQHIPGSGLGLAMVKAIIERHGGTVKLKSQVGEGTTVSLLLPLDNLLPA